MAPNISECHGPPSAGNDGDRQGQPRSKSCSIVSTDFETAIAKAGFGKFNLLMLLIAIPASSTSYFVASSMAYVLPFADDLELTPTKKALILSAPFAGMICSGILWGALSDSFGRQRLLTVGFLLDAVMNAASALIPYVPSILIFKFLSGFMVCGPYSIFMAYLSEMFTEKKREMAVLSTGIFSGILQICQVGLAVGIIPWEPPSWIPLKSWQAFLLICGLPSLICGIACYFCVESPKFLVDSGNSEKALEVCQKIYTINTGEKADNYPVKKIRKPVLTSEKNVSALKKILATVEVLKPPYINRLLLIFGMELCSATTGNLLRTWLPDILAMMSIVDAESKNGTSLCHVLEAGHSKAQEQDAEVMPTNDLYYGMTIMTVFCLVAQVLFILISKYFRKKAIMFGVGIVLMCSCASIPNIPGEYASIPASVAVAAVSIAFYNQVNFLVEIFPTRLRATSVGLNLMVGRIGTLVANFAFANLIHQYCENIFYAMALLSVGIIFFCTLLDASPIENEDVSGLKEDCKK